MDCQKSPAHTVTDGISMNSTAYRTRGREEIHNDETGFNTHSIKNQTHPANGSRDNELSPDQAADWRSTEREAEVAWMEYTEKWNNNYGKQRRLAITHNNNNNCL